MTDFIKEAHLNHSANELEMIGWSDGGYSYRIWQEFGSWHGKAEFNGNEIEKISELGSKDDAITFMQLAIKNRECKSSKAEYEWLKSHDYDDFFNGTESEEN